MTEDAKKSVSVYILRVSHQQMRQCIHKCMSLYSQAFKLTGHPSHSPILPVVVVITTDDEIAVLVALAVVGSSIDV